MTSDGGRAFFGHFYKGTNAIHEVSTWSQPNHLLKGPPPTHHHFGGGVLKISTHEFGEGTQIYNKGKNYDCTPLSFNLKKKKKQNLFGIWYLFGIVLVKHGLH